MKKYGYLFLVFFILLSLKNANAQDSVRYDIVPDAVERFMLEEFYNNTRGSSWFNNTNWLSGNTSAELDTWFGVVVENGDVVEINLNNNNLTGAVPSSIYDLAALRTLSLNGNPVSETNSNASNNNLLSAAPSFLTAAAQANTAMAPIIKGKNLPVWGLAVKGPKMQRIDWKNNPPTLENITNSGMSNIGAGGIAVDKCGRLAFYVLYAGSNYNNQLHLYAENGTRLTPENGGLNGIAGNNEIQVIRVPHRSDEWYIIYSEEKSSGYDPATVLYSKVKYNVDTKVFSILQKDVAISTYTYTHGKAVSKPDANMNHYLYLAARKIKSGTDNNYMHIHRFIIDENSIRPHGISARMNAHYWNLSIVGSTVELNPQGTTLCITNRNQNQNNQDIILFNLAEFDSPSPNPVMIDAGKLVLQPDNINLHQPTPIKQLAVNPNLPFRCLTYFENKLSGAEFSPSGRYLYITAGGFAQGGYSNRTYLAQIDLQSWTQEKGTFDVRLQIQQPVNASDGCTGMSHSGAGALRHEIMGIQSAFDGRLYFTKLNEPYLFVIPNPDDPMPQRLVSGNVDLSRPDAPNIKMNDGAMVIIMPENIDGYDYLNGTELPSSSFSLNESQIEEGQSITLSLTNNATNQYAVLWVDGSVVQNFSTGQVSHTFAKSGNYNIKLTATKTANGCSTSSSQPLKVNNNCIGISNVALNYSKFICALVFDPSFIKPEDCQVTSYKWDFGDGSNSLIKNPLHSYGSDGTYTVSLTVGYQCGACSPTSVTAKTQIVINGAADVLENLEVKIPTDEKQQIISSTVSTFSDAWPLHYNESLNGKNGFVNGSQGVWRSEGSYVYDVPRSLSAETNIAVDGTFSMDQFNWQYADLNGIPHWIKANTITQYSPYSYELENRDPLGIYSAALYDYGGHLPSANGANMRNLEMAFTGFETKDSVSGNWLFSNKQVPAYYTYPVVIGDLYMAIVQASITDLENTIKVDVVARSRFGFFFKAGSAYFEDVNIVCRQPHPQNPGWTIIVFDRPISKGIWTGQIRIKNVVAPAVLPVIDPAFAHTGFSSMKVTIEKTFDQPMLQLEAGKTYLLNGWVSINNVQIPTPKLSNNLGIDVIIKNKAGKIISTVSVQPSGKIIEGWQQVKGVFTCSEKNMKIALKFKPGSSGAAWYDDLRLHPESGNMKSYVYDINDYKLKAILDEENFASLFYYDDEGNLHVTKKETEDGVKTLSENISFIKGN